MIQTLHFNIGIQADKNKVWDALWSDTGYRNWVSVFLEGSYAVTDNWKEGSKVLFLAPDKSGIYSVIEKHIPNEIIQFKHIGTVIDGNEQPIDESSKSWSGSKEQYMLSEENESTKLTVEIDVLDKHFEFMKTTFPKALEMIKDYCLTNV